MNSVNFSTTNDGTWFNFDDDNQELGGVNLRELTFEESRRIEEMTVKSKPRMQEGKWVTESKTDEKKAMELTFGYCIVDWRNVSLDGETVECNLNNKVKAMKSLDFIKFVTRCLSQLKSQNTAIQEARLKNLGST
jgi:hypothetical protein